MDPETPLPSTSSTGDVVSAPADDSANPAEGERANPPEEAAPLIHHPHFDTPGYASSYSGHTKISRLLFIGEKCADQQSQALRLAITELKKGKNTALYKSVCSRVGDHLGAEYSLDQSWIDSIEREAARTLERLESELAGFRTAVIRESTRMGHNALGDFYYERGELASALKAYVRTRDYCTASQHIIEMCLNVIKVSMEMGNFAHVINYVNKAEQTASTASPIGVDVKTRLKVCAGLAHLDSKKYKLAARKFLEASFDAGNACNDVLSAKDIAIYGALTALATFDRKDLKTKVIDNREFKHFLELAPGLREILTSFYGSKYDTTLSLLENLRPDLMLDTYLHKHVEVLYQKIRNKAMVQYFTPFTSVDMKLMSAAFNTELDGLEKELQALILEGAISARIDSHNKILRSKSTNQRNLTFAKSLAMGEAYQLNTKAMLMRMSLLRNDVVVRPPRDHREREHHHRPHRRHAPTSSQAAAGPEGGEENHPHSSSFNAAAASGGSAKGKERVEGHEDLPE